MFDAKNIHSNDLYAPVSFGGSTGGDGGGTSTPNPSCTVDLPGGYCIGTQISDPLTAGATGSIAGIGIIPDTIPGPGPAPGNLGGPGGAGDQSR